MGFADWFELLPRVANFRPLLFCGPSLTIDEGIKAAAWRLSILTFIRILLLSSWGMATIQWESILPTGKLTGIWLEFVILVGLIAISATMMLVTWKFSVKCLYPCIVAIPVIFIFDFSIKATCYEAVFLKPVSGFGILSLIEFWIRYGALIQTWLLLTTVIRSGDSFKSSENVYRASSSIYSQPSTSSIKRANSSLWEKPNQLPKRNASIPPNLPQISERSESYYTDSSYTQGNSSRRRSHGRNERRPASYHNSHHGSIAPETNKQRHSIHSRHTNSHADSQLNNRASLNYESNRDSFQSEMHSAYSDEEVSHPMSHPPPPPRTKPQWNAPEWNHPQLDHAALPPPATEGRNASRQTSNNSSINAFRQNWQGATKWKSLNQPINRINSDMSEMTQYSSNGSPLNRHESPLI